MNNSFLSENFQCFGGEISIYLNRRIFVMALFKSQQDNEEVIMKNCAMKRCTVIN